MPPAEPSPVLLALDALAMATAASCQAGTAQSEAIRKAFVGVVDGALADARRHIRAALDESVAPSVEAEETLIERRDRMADRWRAVAQEYLDQRPLDSIVHPVEQRDALAQWLAMHLPEGLRREVIPDSAEPTLFGHAVGDGLDQERADARLAVELLRSILNDHVMADRNVYEAQAQGDAVIITFGGSMVLSGPKLDLLVDLHVPSTERE